MFWNEFADDQGEIRDGYHHNADGDRLSVRTDHRIGKQKILKPLGECGATEGTGDDGRERHSYLHAREKALRIVRKSQRGTRTTLALFSKLLETAAPRIDHG